MTEKYITETEVRRLLQCSRCKKSPVGPPIYICRTGHLECSGCFAKFSEIPRLDETDASTDSESDSTSNKKGTATMGARFPKDSKLSNNGQHSCPICKEDVLKTRNLLAESLLIQLETTKNEKSVFTGVRPDSNCVECCYNIYGQSGLPITQYESQSYGRYQEQCGVQQYNYQVDPYLVHDPTSPFEFTDPNIFYPDYDDMSYFNGCKGAVVERRLSKYNFGQQPSVLSLSGEPSKRPILCPTHLCGRNIAVTALTSHFCFDHPEVPPVNVDFEVSSHLFVVPDVIPFNYGRCVAMLLIPNRFESVNSVSSTHLMNSAKGKNSLPLVVMASRLDCITNPQGNIAIPEESNRAESLNQGDFHPRERYKSDTSPGKSGTTAEFGNGKTPMLVIWLAGVETSSSLFTTLQVTEKQTNIRSVVYTGPVTSLRSNQNTTKVFEQGDCLVIHSGILENIIGDKGGFDLHIVVH